MNIKDWLANRKAKKQEKHDRKNRELEEIVDRSVNRAIAKHYGKKLNRIEKFVRNEMQATQQNNDKR